MDLPGKGTGSGWGQEWEGSDGGRDGGRECRGTGRHLWDSVGTYCGKSILESIRVTLLSNREDGV